MAFDYASAFIAAKCGPLPEPVKPKPVKHEIHSTILVCTDCLMAHANGEYDPERVEEEERGERPQVWSAIPEGWQVTMGMSWEEHFCRECPGHYDDDAALIGGEYHCDGSCQPEPEECYCEDYGYSSSSCDGCDDGYHGDRYYFTLWSPVAA